MSNESIIPAGTAIETFRDAGYRNTASALAELIDNSIEAEAKSVKVFTVENDNFSGQRLTKRISEIIVYDDGIGMPPEVMKICLQFGNGTRLKSRKGIGRFGIGLPNASVSQCKRVEVYSWRDGVCHWTYLDVDEIKESGQQTINGVIEKGIPKEVQDIVGGKVGEHGTIIIWKKCDRLDIAKAKTLFRRMEDQLCRVYRHFLDSDNKYGSHRSISFHNSSDSEESTVLKANDPLYLMTPNTLKDYSDKATNILHGDVVELELPYNEIGDKGKVEIRFSIALPQTQAEGGNSDLGKHYRRNTGISFVRAAREIDFGSFGYFNSHDERQRWWGCEVRFEPDFDEIFGVTNNKQAVRGAQYLNLKEFKQDHPDDWEHVIADDPRLQLRLELSKAIHNNLKKLNEIIVSRGKGTRGGTAKERAELDKSARIANEELNSSKQKTKSSNDGEGKTKEDKVLEWTKVLLESDTTLSEDEAKYAAETKVELQVEKTFNSWPGSQFFTVETTGATCNLVINRKHPFFKEMYEPLIEAQDHKYIDALDLMMMAYARTQDELYDRIDEIEEINSLWGGYLKKFLMKLGTDA
tara:strand:+ start:10809 stop:12551 length:1743 start_codon:yes stop_codon:yes gene_type:complete